jgi:hypothetical protein
VSSLKDVPQSHGITNSPRYGSSSKFYFNGQQFITTTPSLALATNNYAFGIYNLTWVPGNNYVNFSFTTNVPSNMLSNFWSAFAFSTDNQMVNSLHVI